MASVQNTTATAIYVSDLRLSIPAGATVAIKPAQMNSRDLKTMLDAKFLKIVGQHVWQKTVDTVRGWVPQPRVPQAAAAPHDAMAAEMVALREQLAVLTDVLKRGVPATGVTPVISAAPEPGLPVFIPEVQELGASDVKPDVQTTSGKNVSSAVERLRQSRKKGK
jgi:hypothetical protein